jgi:hypothetical protein
VRPDMRNELVLRRQPGEAVRVFACACVLGVELGLGLPGEGHWAVRVSVHPCVRACVRVCVCACVRARARARVCVCVCAAGAVCRVRGHRGVCVFGSWCSGCRGGGRQARPFGCVRLWGVELLLGAAAGMGQTDSRRRAAGWLGAGRALFRGEGIETPLARACFWSGEGIGTPPAGRATGLPTVGAAAEPAARKRGPPFWSSNRTRRAVHPACGWAQTLQPRFRPRPVESRAAPARGPPGGFHRPPRRQSATLRGPTPTYCPLSMRGRARARAHTHTHTHTHISLSCPHTRTRSHISTRAHPTAHAPPPPRRGDVGQADREGPGAGHGRGDERAGPQLRRQVGGWKNHLQVVCKHTCTHISVIGSGSAAEAEFVSSRRPLDGWGWGCASVSETACACARARPCPRSPPRPHPTPPSPPCP